MQALCPDNTPSCAHNVTGSLCQPQAGSVKLLFVPVGVRRRVCGAAMSLTAAAVGLLLLLLSPAAGQAQSSRGVTYEHYDVCAVKGSTANISCTYRHPSGETVQRSFWFTTSQDGGRDDLAEVPQYSGRVTSSCSGRTCTLTIRELRESDSAEYRFSFITDSEKGQFTGAPGVTLTVTDLQIKVTRLNSDTHPCKMSCDSKCQLSWQPYIWYNNGVKIYDKKTLYPQTIDPKDRYTCAISGYEGSSPAVYAPRPPTVSANPSPDISEGSSVNLTCLSDANPAASYSWSKGNQTLSRYGTELVLRSVQWSDSGEYSCTAENQLGKSTSHILIDVKYGPRFASVSVSPSGEMVEGSAVSLSCSSDANPAANYAWYKDGKELLRGRWFNFSSISSEDSGSYHCSSDNQYGRKDSSPQNISVQCPCVSAVPLNISIMSILRLTLVVSLLPLVLTVILWTRKTKTQRRRVEPQPAADTMQTITSTEYENVLEAVAAPAEGTARSPVRLEPRTNSHLRTENESGALAGISFLGGSASGNRQN